LCGCEKFEKKEHAERQASYNHALDLDNSVKQSFKKEGLAFWVPEDPDRPATDDLKEGEAEAPLLLALSDEESTQSCFANFFSRGPPEG
jgi:hypothetical protein